MDIINTLFGIPLGFLMFLCYAVFSNYGVAIIVFTLLTKIILFPISLMSQKNSIKMVKIQPLMEEITQRYQGDPSALMKEQKALYKKENYSNLKSILPLLIQIPIILGVINIMYNPLGHILRIDKNEIEALNARTAQILQVDDLEAGGDLRIINEVQKNPEAFASLGRPDTIQKISEFHSGFLGMDLSQIPGAGFPLILISLLSALTVFLMCYAQNKLNVLSREQGFFGQWGVTIFIVLFSGYFAWVVPAGVGLYWIIGNLLTILVTHVCNKVYNPEDYIDYQNRSVKPKLTPEEKEAKRQRKKLEKARAKEDSAKFFSIKKELVFYSESSGFYKYFKRFIDYIIENSDIVVHYVTSDMDDQVFKIDNPQFKAYYVNETALITLMMKMDAEIVVMTMPDLEQYHIKRSLVKKDVEYIYTDHGFGSFNMLLRKGALDHFDTIFCMGPSHNLEVQATEKLYNLPEKKLVNTGFGLLDTLLEDFEKLPKKKNKIKKILIAPSWQKDNIMELCLDPILQQLVGKGYHVIVRPHPEFVKRFPGKMNQILEKYKDRLDETFEIQTDFSSNFTVYSSDLVITDWSSIAQEFSFTTKKPSLFINTPIKIMNPEYKRIKTKPIDLKLRDQIGISMDTDKLNGLCKAVNDLIKNTDSYKQKISKVVNKSMYNIGHTAQAGGDYIISAIEEKRKSS